MYIIFIKRCKGTKSRGQNKTNSFVFYAETKYLRDFLPQRYKKKLKLQLYREIIAKRTTFGRLQRTLDSGQGIVESGKVFFLILNS